MSQFIAQMFQAGAVTECATGHYLLDTLVLQQFYRKSKDAESVGADV